MSDIEPLEKELLRRLLTNKYIRGSDLILSQDPAKVEDTVIALKKLVNSHQIHVEGDISSPKSMLDSVFYVAPSQFTSAAAKV